MGNFRISTVFTPRGDQPTAIKELTYGIEKKLRHQVLLGVTGSGKTFTIANVVANVNKPILYWPRTRRLRRSFFQSSENYFQRMRLNILCLTMTIISQRRMCPQPILI